MEVHNRLYPENLESLEKRLANSLPGAVVMVNLLKFRTEAIDEDGEPLGISGKAAYDKYFTAVREVLVELGAHVIYEGRVKSLTIGQVEDLWDKVVLIEYPSLQAFASLASNGSIQAAAKYREAGLEGQLLLEAGALVSS